MIEDHILPPTTFSINFLKKTGTSGYHAENEEEKKISHTTSGFLINNDEHGEKLKFEESLLERVTKYLNALSLFLNSKVVFAEMNDH